MGHGETLKWMYYRAQGVAALQAENRDEDVGNVRDLLTGRSSNLDPLTNAHDPGMAFVSLLSSLSLAGCKAGPCFRRGVLSRCLRSCPSHILCQHAFSLRYSRSPWTFCLAVLVPVPTLSSLNTYIFLDCSTAAQGRVPRGARHGAANGADKSFTSHGGLRVCMPACVEAMHAANVLVYVLLGSIPICRGCVGFILLKLACLAICF